MPASRRRSRRRELEYVREASELSAARRGASQRFARELEHLLADLAMTQARFDVRFNPAPLPEEAWTERGIDQGEFFLSPNPGEDLRPLARIVSGGELSRVMLALKTMSIDDTDSKTLIFDEVDAGIGGRVADVVGSRLGELGGRFQVPLHHPPGADRGARNDALPDRQDGATRAHLDLGSTARLGGSYRRSREDDRRRVGHGVGAGQRPRVAALLTRRRV